MVITGKLHFVEDTKQVSDSFKRRSFVVEYVDNPLFPQYVSFELTQDRVGAIDAFKIGENIEVTFNLRGREWTSPELVKKYFNTLEAWRVQKAESAPTPANVPVDELQQMVDTSSDLPFWYSIGYEMKLSDHMLPNARISHNRGETKRLHSATPLPWRIREKPRTFHDKSK